MEVEQRDSYFRFMLQSHLFAKKTTGIWGTCTVCSHQPALHAVICNSAAGACFFCLFHADLSEGLRPRRHISALQQHIAMKALFCNGRHSVSHIEDVLDVEHQFSATYALKRAFKRRLVVDIHQRVTALHVQVFVSLQNAYVTTTCMCET